MKKVAYILISVICFSAMSLWGAEAPKAAGQFSLESKEDGDFLAEFSAKSLSIEARFPEKPTVNNRTANLIMQNPLVQMSLLVVDHQDMDAENIIEMMMSIIDKEYTNMNLNIVEAQKTEIEREDLKKGTKTTQQYIVDLGNKMREFTTFNIYQDKQYDVVVMTRFILSPDEKDDQALRTKGNDAANKFLDNTTVEFK